MFAELKLSFSLVVMNVLCVDAELHQLDDKTTSARVGFDQDFLVNSSIVM